MKSECPLQKILLPFDGSDDSKRAVEFTGCLGSLLGKSLLGIAILRVLIGGYLSRHLANIDFRAADILKKSATFKRVREDHIAQNIFPLLGTAEETLIDLGVDTKIDKLVTDGDAANEIVRMANEGNFSTIIMARRGLSAGKGAFIGSVTNKVIHATSRHTVYVVGQKIMKGEACPIPKILIPVDGSTYSMKGVEHAACLIANIKQAISGITLLRVINLAFFMERLKQGIDPEEEAQKILDESKKLFLKTGVPESFINVKVTMGTPSDEILKEAEKEDYNLIIIGRKGRSALKDILLGGVSSTVLQKIQNPTVAIVSSE